MLNICTISFNIQLPNILSKECIYGFYFILKINSDDTSEHTSLKVCDNGMLLINILDTVHCLILIIQT
jgi:hypothetical protein